MPLRGFLRSAGLLFAARIGTALFWLIITIAITRHLSVAEVGVVMLFYAVSLVAGGVLLLGTSVAALRFIGEVDGSDDRPATGMVTLGAQRIAVELGIGVLACGILLHLAGAPAALGLGERVASGFAALVLWVVGTGLRLGAFDLLIALRMPGLAAIYSGFGPSAVTAACILGLIIAGMPPDLGTVLAIAAGASLASGLSAHLLVLRRARQASAGREGYGLPARRNYYRVGLPLVASQALNSFDKETVVFLLGIFASLESVASIGLANQISLVVAMPLAAISSLILAEISRANGAGALQSAMPRIRTLWCIALVPIVILAGTVLIMAESVSVLAFGSDYDNLPSVLIVSILGQLALVLFGPSRHAIMMVGHEKALLAMSALKMVIVVLLTSFLGAQYGAVGGAWAFTLSVLFISILQTAYIRIKLQMWVFAWVFPASLRK